MSDIEYLDVLFEDGTFKGSIKSRNKIHKDGDWHRTVHVWIYNENEGLLIQKRSDSKESYPGYWDVSCAGHVSSGDSSRESAIRELSEELGISVSVLELKKICKIRESYCNEYIKDNELKDIFLITRNIPLHKFILQDEEVSDVKYLKLTELKDIIHKKDSKFVPHWEEYKKIFNHITNTI